MISVRVGCIGALVVLIGLFSCESIESEIYSKENVMLIGTWTEKIAPDSADTWVFTSEEVKWKNFSNTYIMEGRTLIISGMNYQISEQSMDSVVLLSPFRKEIRLIRMD